MQNILAVLGVNDEETKTYLSLLETGESTASALAKRLGIPRPSIYGFLKRLRDKGLVRESQKSGVARFAAENPDKINLLFEREKELLTVTQDAYKKLLPELSQKHAAKFVNPRLQLFEGAEGLKKVLNDMLLYRDMETQAFWPIKKMVEVLGADFFRYHNKERIKSNLYTRAIWPDRETVDIKNHPYLGVGEDFKREIRIAPKEVDFSMGYWIYGAKAAFISSRKESFGFILESAEFVETLLAQFEILWRLSKPLKVQVADTKSFLEELERYS